ncbi:hypothetical protein LSAT2_006805, partial [Lamellibrachia satsuma]
MTQKENHATRPLTWYGACISGCRFTASDAIRSDRIYVYLGQGVSDIQAEPGEPLTRVSPESRRDTPCRREFRLGSLPGKRPRLEFSTPCMLNYMARTDASSMDIRRTGHRT